MSARTSCWVRWLQRDIVKHGEIDRRIIPLTIQICLQKVIVSVYDACALFLTPIT
jgi:hypothetical protein